MSILRPTLLACLLLSNADLSAQSVKITGTVRDARTGLPLSGAIVMIDGHTQVAGADRAGRFLLEVPPGRYDLIASLVGYSLYRRPVEVVEGPSLTVDVELSEGAGEYAEHMTVSARQGEPAAGPNTVLHGGDLQALRGLVLDDPLRAVHATPAAAPNDDLFSEFSVRGHSFRQIGLTVDGVPAPYLFHSVHGVADSGSTTMVNSDAVGSVSLLPGSYSQRLGRRLGAQLEITMRDGNRQAFRARAGLSGTSAGLLAEGPLGGGRGSWLVSVRRSYLDLLLKRLAPNDNLAFGFTDAGGKLVYDVGTGHQLQVLTLVGASAFTEAATVPAINDEARGNGRTWLTSASWRASPSSRFLMVHRLHGTGLLYENRNYREDPLDDAGASTAGWRTDAMVAIRPGAVLEFGGDLQLLRGRHARQRSLDGGDGLIGVGTYSSRSSAGGMYAQSTLTAASRLTVVTGGRVDRWGSTDAVHASPWVNGALTLAPGTRIGFGSGIHHQFPDLDQVHGIHGGGNNLKAERAHHLDVALTHDLPWAIRLEITGYRRHERDVLWRYGAEPRREEDGTMVPGRADAPWQNRLHGSARGVEVLIRRDVARGLAGWIGYAYGRHRYTDASSGEPFWSDRDQRHALTAYGTYRLTSRTSVGAKFRYGSNFPQVGYIGSPSAGGPPLFGGAPAGFQGLVAERNTLRLPAYARLDLRGDRTFSVGRSRLTVFVEIANALNRQNVRNVPYDVDADGRILGGTGNLMPLVPSAGFVIEF